VFSDTAASVVRTAIRRLSRARLDPQELLYEASVRVGRVVAHDASGWMTVDPDTLLPSGTLETDKPPEFVRALWRRERLTPDVQTLNEIVQWRTPLATTRTLAPDVREWSPRARLMAANGLSGDDLRVVFRANGHPWGFAALYRADGARPFDERERAFMAEIASDIALGLQDGLLRPPAGGLGVLDPGVVVFDAEGRITSTSAEARTLTRVLDGDATSTLYAVAMAASTTADARARVRLADGRWVQLHGAQLDGDDVHAKMAVTLLPATHGDLISMLLRLHGLTARERQVAELLAVGASTDDIAVHLHISRHTLRDHVKTIFRKVGVSSRAQLMAHVNGYVASAAGEPLPNGSSSTPVELVAQR
jgi:DNA-binding CsgD family transcriptional regulator